VSRQWPQLLQCPPEHPAHPALEVLLATILLPPPASRLTAANTEMARCTVSEPHFGHSIGASIWLMARSASKRLEHTLHWYS
jgi:hypothetical protein